MDLCDNIQIMSLAGPEKCDGAVTVSSCGLVKGIK
jgi:hypothetical protein